MCMGDSSDISDSEEMLGNGKLFYFCGINFSLINEKMYWIKESECH